MSVKKGMDAIKDVLDSGASYLKISPGKHKVMRILTPASEMLGVFEHVEQFGGSWRTVTCLGKNICPLCQAERKPSFRVYLNVVDREDDKVKVFKVSKTVATQLSGLMEEYGDLTARDFKVSRQGEKLNTTYQFFPRDPQPIDSSVYVLNDLDEIVKSMSREDVLALMSSNDNMGHVSESNISEESRSGHYPF